MSAWGKGGIAKSCTSLLKRVEENDPTLVDLVILPNKTFCAMEVERLAASLACEKNTHLRSLSASGHCIPPASLRVLGCALASQAAAGGSKTNNVGIKSIAIGDQTMGNHGIVELCSALEVVRGGLLEYVDFEWKSFSEEGMAAIGKTFGSSTRLRHLNLSRNDRAGDRGVIALCENAVASTAGCGTEDGLNTVVPMSNLEELNLSGCTVGPDGAKALLDFLSGKPRNDTALGSDCAAQHRELLNLNLSSNPLGPEGVHALSALLCSSSREGSSLASLLIARCKIGDDGIDSIRTAAMSGSCSGLCLLDMSHNNIGPVGARVLAETLALGATCWTTLREINMAGNNIGEDGVISLVGALPHGEQRGTEDDKESPSLKDSLEKVHSPGPGKLALTSLDLTQTNCGARGALAALRCTCLQTLRLFNNNLGSDGFEKMTPLLIGGHPSLENLDLGGNSAKDAAVAGLLRAILVEKENQKSTLKVLELGGNEVGSEVEEVLEKMKEMRPELDVAHDRPRSEVIQTSCQNR